MTVYMNMFEIESVQYLNQIECALVKCSVVQSYGFGQCICA